MPDTRKKHTYPGPLPGFKPGQGRSNETGNQGTMTVDGTTYEIHVTVEGTTVTSPVYVKAPGQKKGKGQKKQYYMVTDFHVSLYRANGSRANGYYWSYNSGTDQYEALGWQEAPTALPWTTAGGSTSARNGVTNRANRRIRSTFGATLQPAGLTRK